MVPEVRFRVSGLVFFICLFLAVPVHAVEGGNQQAIQENTPYPLVTGISGGPSLLLSISDIFSVKDIVSFNVIAETNTQYSETAFFVNYNPAVLTYKKANITIYDDETIFSSEIVRPGVMKIYIDFPASDPYRIILGPETRPLVHIDFLPSGQPGSSSDLTITPINASIENNGLRQEVPVIAGPVRQLSIKGSSSNSSRIVSPLILSVHNATAAPDENFHVLVYFESKGGFSRTNFVMHYDPSVITFNSAMLTWSGLSTEFKTEEIKSGNVSIHILDKSVIAGKNQLLICNFTARGKEGSETELTIIPVSAGVSWLQQADLPVLANGTGWVRIVKKSPETASPSPTPVPVSTTNPKNYSSQVIQPVGKPSPETTAGLTPETTGTPDQGIMKDILNPIGYFLRVIFGIG